MVRSMMFFKNVKLMFWADAVLCAVYVKNRCPSHALKNKTPYEMWYGHIPSVRHLRVFGSTCYALIPKDKEASLMQGVRSASSWGTQIPPRDIIFMMRQTRNSSFPEM
jgi:hypothetical protein